MHVRGLRLISPLTALVIPFALTAAACGVPIGGLEAKASDSWTHTYPLANPGEVVIGNANGRVEVEGVDGSTVEVHADRIARGATDQVARELLPRITIKEEVAPDRVSIQTDRISGIMIGVGYEVRYHVKAPRTATVRTTTTNGGVSLTSLDGRVVARTTNGGITATEIKGGIEARSTNGGVRVQLASVGPDEVHLTTTNGGVRLVLPENAKATVTGTWTNGGMTISGLNFEVTEQSRRRFEGRLNGGGTPVDLRTTNGGIAVQSTFPDIATWKEAGARER